MTKFELERIENIKNNGELLVNEIGGNWDLYFYNNIVWSVPKVGIPSGLFYNAAADGSKPVQMQRIEQKKNWRVET